MIDFYTVLRLSDFTDYHQMIRDNYEQTIRNDRRGRNLEIEIDEKYQTPADYKKMIENLENGQICRICET